METSCFAFYLHAAKSSRITLTSPVKRDVRVDLAKTLPIKSGLVNSFREPLSPLPSLPRVGGWAKNDYLRATSRRPGALEHRNRCYGYSFCASWKLPSDKFLLRRRGAEAKFRICRGYAADAFARTVAPTPSRETTRRPPPPFKSF